MTILQIILIVIGLGGLILAGVSLIAMQRGGEYSNIYSCLFGVVVLVLCGIVLLLAGCGGTDIQQWHRDQQTTVFEGACWSHEGHGCYSKTIGTVSCVAILSGGVYRLQMGYYGIHDGGYRGRECVLAIEAIQAFEHYAAQRNPYRWDQARADSMRLRYCGHRTEESMREEAFKILTRLREDTDTLAPHQPEADGRL